MKLNYLSIARVALILSLASACANLLAKTNTDPAEINSSSTDTFEIIKQFPVDRSDRVVISNRTYFVEFNQTIAPESFDASTALTVTERDSGDPVAGTAALIDQNRIIFTPETDLKLSAVYQFNVSNALVSVNGDSFAGQSNSFTTLFDVGLTTQETINKCGNPASIKLIHFVSTERAAGVNSQCATQFNFSQQTPVAMSCALNEVALDAVRTKANTLNLRTGSYNPAFNYQRSAAKQGLNVGNVFNASSLSVRSAFSASDYYDNNLSQNVCSNIMQPNVSHVGVLLTSVAGRFGNIFRFYEGVFAKLND